MIGPIQREKTYEALAFFSANVRHAGRLKLFKLLYYLDLIHFRRTGRVVTGLVYEAWPMGPVPAELDNEIKDKTSDLYRHFDIRSYKKVDHYETPTIDSSDDDLAIAEYEPKYVPGAFIPKTKFKHAFLTMREMEVAELLAEIFRDVTAEVMTDVSHNKFGPWRKALLASKSLGVDRPEIDLMQGVVAAGDPKKELSQDELSEIVAERRLINEALI
jgi:uncharacterized phage-associated protein